MLLCSFMKLDQDLQLLSGVDAFVNRRTRNRICLYHYVFVDESGCDKRIGFRRTGWSPLGVTPV